jgi:nickel-type superoxide dismutase maturation protease
LSAHSSFFMKKVLRKSNWRERFLFLIGLRKAFRVEGNSMLPTLKDGDVVLISPRACGKVGDIVLAKHPFKKSVKILKRIKEFNAGDDAVLTGDNAEESTDSRTFGAVPVKYLLGRVDSVLKRKQ